MKRFAKFMLCRYRLPNGRSISRSSIASKDHTFLPVQFHHSHELCFLLHDIMVEMIRATERNNLYQRRIEFSNLSDKLLFEQEDDVFNWLLKSGREIEAQQLISRTIFPAALSDALHCIYEALECSRKAKLTQAFMLLRKPTQESMYLFECILADLPDFVRRLTIDPSLLNAGSGGGADVYIRRTSSVLALIEEENYFDAAYLSQLRFNKSSEDSFAGAYDKSIHLFTGHPSIKTEKMNINFIFLGPESKISQWSYLYSRLPYLLTYMYRMIEKLCGQIAKTDPIYLEYLERRICASIALWWTEVLPPYPAEPLAEFASRHSERVADHCRLRGYSIPARNNLIMMAELGAFPGEKIAAANQRIKSFGKSKII